MVLFMHVYSGCTTRSKNVRNVCELASVCQKKYHNACHGNAGSVRGDRRGEIGCVREEIAAVKDDFVTFAKHVQESPNIVDVDTWIPRCGGEGPVLWVVF